MPSRDRSEPSRRLAVAGALVAVVIWGASFPATKRALAELSVETLVFSRAVLGTALVLVFLLARGRVAGIRRADLGALVALSLLGNVLPQWLQGQALVRSSAANTAWLVALSPVVTAVLAARLLGEHLRGRVAGIVIAFLGVLLVVSGGRSPGAALGLPSTRGDLLTLASTGSWALYTIYGRRFVAGYPAAVAMVHLLAVSVAVFTPGFVAHAGWAELAALSPEGWLCVLFLGLGCSALAFTLWYAALEAMDATQVAAFVYVEPLVAQAIARALLGEPLHAATLVGGAAILVGVYLVTRAGVRERAGSAAAAATLAPSRQ
jgi:drug/metabolite transporter (DMT)-like permease